MCYANITKDIKLILCLKEIKQYKHKLVTQRTSNQVEFSGYYDSFISHIKFIVKTFFDSLGNTFSFLFNKNKYNFVFKKT